MKILFVVIAFLSCFFSARSQSEQRIAISSIIPSENTGQDYSPWLTDDLNDLVQGTWGNNDPNNKYIDVTLKLTQKVKLSKVSLYDYQGQFPPDHIASIYALNGTQKILLGTFDGSSYLTFVDLYASSTIIADAIIVHKFGNDIPQKVRIYGEPIQENISEERIPILSAIPNENTGQDYTPWLNDNLEDLVQGTWGNNDPNNKYIDVTLKLGTKAKLSKVSLYDHQGQFPADHIASVYALNGSKKTFLGTFDGSSYLTFVDIKVDSLLIADAIVIHKYGNDIPQKVRAYGIPVTETPVEERISIVSAIPSENTGQDYSPWLNDNLEDLVQGTWGNNDPNNKYIDVTLKLAQKAVLTKVSLYDHQGQFPADHLAYIYALNGTHRTLLGTFDGSAYLAFVDIKVENILADAIVVRKFGNDIPQKVRAYGFSSSDTAGVKKNSVITFSPLVDKTIGDPPFNLLATSTNPTSPITFSSSDSTIVSISNSTGSWTATLLKEGLVNIIANQLGNDTYLDAFPISRSLKIKPLSVDTSIQSTRISLDWKRWYHLNNNIHFDQLTDGIASPEVQTIRDGKILKTYDSYYPLRSGEEMIIDAIRFYDGLGMDTQNYMKLSIITDTWERIQIASFTGQNYLTWVGPYPDRPNVFKLDTVIRNARYLLITADGMFPTEIELYGTYKPGVQPSQAVKKPVKLKDMFAVNAYEWDFENLQIEIDPGKLKAAKSFTGIRHYMDWEKLEGNEGSYTFNPTRSGSWDYDSMYETCKAEGIEVLACIKAIPAWLKETYPPELQDNENVPARYGSDLLNPVSYIEQAKCAFQFAARYGSNKNVNPGLLSVNSTPRWTHDPVNTVKIGMDLVKYFECDNERDKWWKGRQGYQTGREYAANLSAFYDGHKNTMGPGVGVKNADPNMKVVMCGIATVYTDYVKGMVDWCKEFRGYNADSTVNLCWDVVNYHAYSNDAQSSQDGRNTRGAAPEVGGLGKVAADFVQMSHEFSNNMEVWVTETGYDINQGSPLKAIPIGNKSAEEVQADWILRTSLLYARNGVTRCFFYQMYDQNVNFDLVFQSSGLIRGHDLSRKPAADYLYQTNKLFGEYVHKETLSNDPFVDRYELNGKSVYSLLIPDEKGRTANYTLSLPGVDSVYIYRPKAGQDDMVLEKMKIEGGLLPIQVTETPIFVKAVKSAGPGNHFTWTGNESTDLDNKNNWINTITGVSGDLPDEKSTIKIPAGLSRYPIMTTVFALKNITIEQAASFNLNGYNLEVYGDLINKGQLLHNTKQSSSLVFNRADSIQTFEGNTLPGSSSTGKIILNNSYGLLLKSGELDVYDFVKVNKGILQSNGFLTLKSNAANFASIAEIPQGSFVSGNVNIETFFSGATASLRGNRLISSPINDNQVNEVKTFAQIKKQVIVTGNGGLTNGFDPGTSSDPFASTIFRYYEPASIQQFNPIQHINETFTPGTGAVLFYRGDRTGYSPETASTSFKLNSPFAVPEHTIVRLSGPINQGNVPVSLSSSYHPEDVFNGYNLVGNPYPCAIDWKLLSKTELADTYMIVKPDGSIATYSNGVISNAGSMNMRYIQPGQGFYVQAYYNINAALTFTEASKVTGKVYPARFLNVREADINRHFVSQKQAGKNETQASELRVQLIYGENKSEETVIVFQKDATDKYSIKDGDAGYLSLTKTGLSSLTSDKKEMTINFMSDVSETREIPLNIRTATTGSMSLTITSLSSKSVFYLKDNYLNVFKEIKLNESYSFYVDQKLPASFESGRFVILTSPSENQAESRLSVNPNKVQVNIYPNPTTSNVHVQLGNSIAGINISIFDLSGKLLKTTQSNKPDTLIDMSSFTSNVYLLVLKDLETDAIIYKEKLIKR